MEVDGDNPGAVEKQEEAVLALVVWQLGLAEIQQGRRRRIWYKVCFTFYILASWVNLILFDCSFSGATDWDCLKKDSIDALSKLQTNKDNMPEDTIQY